MTGLTTRVAVTVVLLAATAGIERVVSGQEAAVHRTPLQTLPLVVDGWHGRAAPLASDVVALLGVDDHVYRTYVRGGVPLNLYAGYYDSQRRGDTMHSPRNCLPGAGCRWFPVSPFARQRRRNRLWAPGCCSLTRRSMKFPNPPVVSFPEIVSRRARPQDCTVIRVCCGLGT